MLNYPALTGMATEDVNALAAALEVSRSAAPPRAAQLRRPRPRPGGAGDRVNAVRNGGGPSATARLALANYVLAVPSATT